MTEHLRDAELQLYLDHQLEERTKLDHLRGCPVCQERLDRYEPLFARLSDAPAWSPSPELTEKVMRKIKRETLGPLYQNLLNIIFIIGGIIAALSISMPYLHPESYVKGARQARLPRFDISWDWLKQLNFLPGIEDVTSKLTLPNSTLLIFAAALLLVVFADQLITLARNRSASHHP